MLCNFVLTLKSASILQKRCESSGNCILISSELMKIDSRWVHVRWTSNHMVITWSAWHNFVCHAETSSRKCAMNFDVIRFCSCTYNTTILLMFLQCPLFSITVWVKFAITTILFGRKVLSLGYTMTLFQVQ